jgi:hypothetical protein
LGVTPTSTIFIPDADHVNDPFSLFQPTRPSGPSYDLTGLPAPVTTNQTTTPPPATPVYTVPTDILSTLDGSESFTEICNALDIDMDLSVKPARYIEVSSKQPNALVVMVLNHQAMSQLLVRLGQPNHKDDPQATSITTYSAGLTVSSCSIILELGWTQVSYAHKSNWYEWATSVALASWTGSLLSEIQFLLSHTYSDYI